MNVGRKSRGEKRGGKLIHVTRSQRLFFWIILPPHRQGRSLMVGCCCGSDLMIVNGRFSFRGRARDFSGELIGTGSSSFRGRVRNFSGKLIIFTGGSSFRGPGLICTFSGGGRNSRTLSYSLRSYALRSNLRMRPGTRISGSGLSGRPPDSLVSNNRLLSTLISPKVFVLGLFENNLRVQLGGDIVRSICQRLLRFIQCMYVCIGRRKT